MHTCPGSRIVARVGLTLLALATALAVGRPSAVLATSVCPNATTLYVNAAVSSSGGGTTWATAYKTLAEALTTAASCSTVSQIWVAKGTYKPAGPNGDRGATFQLKSGLAIYGGFSGNGTETAYDQRNSDPYTNGTTLSGDLNGDDTSFGVGNGENSYHVVTGSGADSTAVLDGFTVMLGNANNGVTCPGACGAGLYNSGGSPTLTHVVLGGDYATQGGGMYNANGGSPTLTSVSFRLNSATDGGGLYTDGGAPTLTNVDFGLNTATNGAAMYNINSSPTLMNVTFVSNSAGSDSVMSGKGGGLFNGSGSPNLTNVIFSGNSAWDKGGALYNGGGNSTLTNVSFTNNTSPNGSGLTNEGGSPTIRNSILWGDLIVMPTGVIYNEILNLSGTVTVSFSIVEASGGSGSAWWAANFIADGGSNLDQDPLFINPFADNLRLKPGSPAINTGNNNVTTPMLPATDIEGNPRIIGPKVDMGAYENTCPVGAPLTFYVDASVSGGTADGSSWADAYPTLSAALTRAAKCNNVTQIWVAKGTYKPAGPNGDRSATFMLINGLAIYGGFTSGQTDLSQRDASPATNGTRLSGDLNGDDSPNFANNGENSYHVVADGSNPLAGADGTAILDGFTIRGGHANGGYAYGCGDKCGAGMIAWGSPTLTNVTFSGNLAENGGGGLYSDGGNPTLTNVTFSGNSATQGGGMFANRGSPTLTNVTFSGNSAYQGGGMIANASSPTLTNVVFSGNSATHDGGGVFANASSPTLTNVVFSGNSATHDGGGVFANGGGPTLTNVTFSGNSANQGGGVFSTTSSLTIRNSILWGNAGGEIYAITVSPTISYSIVQGSGGSTSWNGSLGNNGGGNLDKDPLFISPITAAAPTTTGNLRLSAGSPAVNVGSNTVTNPTLPDNDLDGKPRIVDTTVDMGAYERQDNTPPTNVSGAPTTPPDGTNSWYKSRPTVAFTGTDTGSGIASCTITAYGGPDGTGLTVNGTCTDTDGNTSAPVASSAFKVDTAPPTNVSGAPTSPPNGANNWYKSPPTVTFTGIDATSNIASCSSAVYSGPDGSGLTVNGTCTDNAGNTSVLVASSAFKLDTKAPTLNPSLSPSQPIVGSPATASPNATDTGSGIATQGCDPVDTSSVGTKTLNCTATDNAGNTSTVQVSYVVGYKVTYVSPTVGAPSVNSLYPLSIGTTATPVKWTLKNGSGQLITAAGTVTGVSYRPNPGCGTFPTDPIGATAASITSANPKYDTLQKLWVYNWGLPGRGCYTLFITLNGGQVLSLFYHIY